MRHASVVGAVHDSRAAERGYSGYARYTSDAGESGAFGPYDVPPSYDETDWYGAAGEPGPADASHPSGPLPGTHGGYGTAGPGELYGTPVYTEADYGDTGAGDGGYEAGDGTYEASRGRYEGGGDGSYDDGPYEETPYGAAYAQGYAGGQYAAGSTRQELRVRRGGRQPARDSGRRLPGPPGRPGTAATRRRGTAATRRRRTAATRRTGTRATRPAVTISRATRTRRATRGRLATRTRAAPTRATWTLVSRGRATRPAVIPATRPQAYPEPAARQGYKPAAPAGQDYGYQDYGDPRYDDPSYGDLAYDDTPDAGAAYAGTAEAEPSYQDQDDGYQDTGYGGHGYGGYQDAEVQNGPASPDAGYGTEAYPDGYDGAAGYEDPGQELAAYAGGDPAYAAERLGGPGFGDPERGPYGPDGVPGYVSSEYVSGQYPAGAGAIGELSAGLPDPAATGMLEATGMLDSTGISDHVELYNFHPGAAEASQGFLDAPGSRDVRHDRLRDPSGFAGGPAARAARRIGAGTVLGGAEAGAATGVLEGGSGFFDHVDPADTSIDLPAASLGRGAKTGGTGALLRPRPGNRPAGRRRGRSGDRRLWFALAGVVVVFGGALAAIFMLAFPSGPGGPDHTLVTPDKLNSFIRRPALEQQMNVGQLRQDVVNMSSGQARHVVEAVYEAGDSTSGTTPQIVLFIGGNLLNASPKVSVTSFTQRFKGAHITSAGSLGGEAACVNATASEPGSVAMCAWFDNDSFGEVVSPTMNASALANTMRQIRPHVELVVEQKP